MHNLISNDKFHMVWLFHSVVHGTAVVHVNIMEKIHFCGHFYCAFLFGLTGPFMLYMALFAVAALHHYRI